MELLQELNSKGVTIQLVDLDRLALTPKERVTPELVEKVRARKQELLRVLRDTQDKGRNEIVDPVPELRTITLFSKVFNREVFISWEGANPQTVLFDGIRYTIDEIARLKEIPLTADDLRTIHGVKVQFEGELLD